MVKESVTSYVRSKNKTGGVSWSYLYTKFGAKKVNAAIKRGSIYSQMNGRAYALRK